MIPLQIPDDGFPRRIGMVVFLVADLEGLLKSDLVRFHPLLPPELDFGRPQGQAVTGMTTAPLGKYFLAHAPKSTDPAVAEYYRVGGEALVEIAPKRNAMLHSQPGVDGYDPQQKLRLLGWRISETNYEVPHLIGQSPLQDRGVVPGAGLMLVAQPFFEVDERQRLWCVEKLGGDRRSGPVASQGSTRISFRHSGFAAQCGNQMRVEVGLSDELAADADQELMSLTGLAVDEFGLRWVDGFPRVDEFTDERVHRFGERPGGLVRRDVQKADRERRSGVLVTPFVALDAIQLEAADLVDARSGEEPHAHQRADHFGGIAGRLLRDV